MSPSEDVASSVTQRHDRILRRRRRQTFTFLGLFGLVLMVGLVALGNWEGWWTIGGTAEAAVVTCPVQETSDPALTQVNVLNGTGRHGLATAVARELQARRFQVVEINTEAQSKPIDAVAFVRYGPLGRIEAQTVALEFPGKVKLVNDRRTTLTVDVVLGEKYRQLTNAKKAAAAIALKPVPDGCVDPASTATPTATAVPTATSS